MPIKKKSPPENNPAVQASMTAHNPPSSTATQEAAPVRKRPMPLCPDLKISKRQLMAMVRMCTNL